MSYSLANPESDASEIEDSALELHELSKRFGGVQAVDSVSMVVHQNEMVGLIGPNGAGKTTLLNLIGGVFKPDEGTVRLGAAELEFKGPRGRAHAGIGRTFQNMRLFRRLTVRQNIEVAAFARRRKRSHVTVQDADGLLDRFELGRYADDKAGTLPYGHQRRLEIARALALDPDFLLLDEPAAGMNDAESEQLAADLRDVHQTERCGLIVIDHDLNFIMSLCDRLYVLHEGSVIAEGSPQQIRADKRVREVYLGQTVDNA